MMRSFALGLLAVLGCCAVAHAGPVEDGNAGLAALDRGAFDEAIRLFTRALTAKKVAVSDREFAYVSRGRAYLGKGDSAHATADFKSALRLNPKDDDALAALADATATSAPKLAEQAPPSPPRDPWGMLSGMVGKYYWYEIQGADPHAAYYRVDWVVPQQLLAGSIKGKKGVLGVFETKLDGVTGKLLEAQIVGAETYYSTAESSATVTTEYGWFKSKDPIRSTERLQPDQSISVVAENYIDGAWKQTGQVVLVEASEDELIAQGLMKKKKKK